MSKRPQPGLADTRLIDPAVLERASGLIRLRDIDKDAPKRKKRVRPRTTRTSRPTADAV